MKPYLYLLFCILMLSCSDKDEPEPRVRDISSIAGTYLGTLQHDVIKSNSRLFEENNTTNVVDGFKTIVTYDNQEVTLKFPISGEYILPELKYKVDRIEESQATKIVDVYMELLTTDKYRTRAGQVVFPAFRMWDGSGSINGSAGVEIYIFLRSQDPDSVYNIIVQGMKR